MNTYIYILESYQVDFAYFNKAERINVEMQQILRNEKHWFNEPILLPKYLQPYYNDFQRETNLKLLEMGEPVEPDWATFDPNNTNAELYKLSLPVTKLLYGFEDEGKETDSISNIVQELETSDATGIRKADEENDD